MKPKPPKKRSPFAAALASPAFRKKVVPSKKSYNRKKVKGEDDGNDD